MIYYLSPHGQDAVRANRLRIIAGESPQARYNRLYRNKFYTEFKYYAFGAGLDEVNLGLLLSMAAIDLCYMLAEPKGEWQKFQAETFGFEANTKLLAKELAGKGASVNMAAIRFLMLFHPNAIDIYFGREAKL